MSFKNFFNILKEAAIAWYNHNAFRFGASLAFYTVVSLSPLILIVLSITGLILGDAVAREQLVRQIDALIGGEGAEAIRTVIEHRQSSATSVAGTVFGILAFLIGFFAVFYELQSALNTLWNVKARPEKKPERAVRKLVLTFGLMAVFGFLMLISLFVNAWLTAAEEYLSQIGSEFTLLWQALNFILSAAIALFLFAILYKYLPSVEIAWNDVWIGAIITMVLFMVGKLAIGFYLGQSDIASSYGAAGSIIILLLWIYYSAQILFYGAEITRIYANRFGSQILPAEDAEPLQEQQTQHRNAPKENTVVAQN